VRSYPLVAYFIIAYGITWSIGFTIAASVQGWIDVEISPSVHFLTAYGPLISAFIVTGLIGGTSGIRELVGRMVRWRVGIWWIFIALFSLVVLYLIATLIMRGWSGVWPNFNQFGGTLEIAGLGWLGGWIFHILTFGFGEETGWRGFALPRLQRGRSALSATLILWVFWALWHLPMFFYKESYMSMSAPMILLFLLGMLAGSIVLTWLYNSTTGSILMVALWHGTYNATVTATEPMITAIVSTFIWIAAVIIVLLAKPTNLSRSEKQTM
jgi:membrane protease YdiL (CAAX protease family)